MIPLPQRPSVIAFDVLETLFPLGPLGDRLAQVGVRPDLLGLWFTRLLRDGFALTATGVYRPFADVAAAALHAVADVSLSDQAVQTVLAGFAELDPHPEVAEAMRRAREADVRVIALTNGAVATTSAMVDRAGVHAEVEQVVSIDAVRRWKPAPEVYRHAATACGVPAERMALVAAHGWDVHGAHRAGLTTGWVSRSERCWTEVFDSPDVTGPDLVAVVDGLLALGERGE